jgi:hypothetical protein
VAKYVGHVADMHEMLNTCVNLVAKPQGTRRHGKLRHGSEDIIKRDLKRMECFNLDLSGSE